MLVIINDTGQERREKREGRVSIQCRITEGFSLQQYEVLVKINQRRWLHRVQASLSAVVRMIGAYGKRKLS